MWILLAFGSAFFAALTAILAKIGLGKMNSTLATAIRTIVVLLFAWLMVFVSGQYRPLSEISGSTMLFLVLSGLATGASWLCYFHALQIGPVSSVAAVDKSSTVLTILLALIFLHEPLTWAKGIGVVMIAVGTWMMLGIQKGIDEPDDKKGTGWLLFAFGAAVFAALTAILGKIGMEDIPSNLGTAIRTAVVLVMSWIMVLVSGTGKEMKRVTGKEVLFLILSGLATGGSWLCYYHALQLGPASVVVPIDKLSLLVTVLLSWLFFRERLSKRSAIGLAIVTIGTLVMLI